MMQNGIKSSIWMGTHEEIIWLPFFDNHFCSDGRLPFDTYPSFTNPCADNCHI